MPTVREEDVELVDADAATCFYHSELYYPALQEALSDGLSSLSASFAGQPLWGGRHLAVSPFNTRLKTIKDGIYKVFHTVIRVL